MTRRGPFEQAGRDGDCATDFGPHLPMSLSLSSALEKARRVTAILLARILGIRFAISYLRNPDPSASVFLLRHFGAQVGEGSTIKRSVFLDNVTEDAHSCGTF